MTGIGVVVATFGDPTVWGPLARRAARSVGAQTAAAQGVWAHGRSVAAARNHGAWFLACEEPVGHLIFLDGDDELDGGYVAAMSAAVDQRDAGLGPAIFRPSTIGVYEDGTTDADPVMLPRTDMRRRNCCVIGSMVPAGLFHELGGFDPTLDALEDWHLWRRCIAAGAVIVDVPDAVYRVHVRPGSRNAPNGAHHDAYRRILRTVPL